MGIAVVAAVVVGPRDCDGMGGIAELSREEIMTRMCLVAAGATAVVASMLTGVPVARGASAARAVAAFLMTKNDPDPETLAAFQSHLESVSEQIAVRELIAGEALRQRLEAAGKTAPPPALVLGCGSDLTCFAELGRSVGADEVMLVRVAGSASGAPSLSIKVLVVDVQRADVARTLKFTIASLANVEPTLAANAAELFDVPKEVSLAAKKPAQAKQMMEAKDLTAGGSPASEKLTKLEPASAGGSSKTAGSRGRLSAIGKSPPARGVVPWWQNHPLFRYGGIGVAGVGVIGAGIGALFGFESISTGSSIVGATPLPEAVQLEASANSAAARANGFVGVGSALVVIGGALLAWDLVGIDWFSAPLPAVEVTAGGASAMVHIPW